MKIFRRKITQIPAHITRTRKKRRPERQTRSSSTIRFNSGLCPKGTTRDDSTLSSPTRRWSARSWWRKSGSSPKYRPSYTSPNQGSSRRRQALSRIPSAHNFVSWMAINIRPPPPFRWLQSRSPQHIARQEFVRRYYKSTPVQSGVALLIVLVKITSSLFRNIIISLLFANMNCFITAHDSLAHGAPTSGGPALAPSPPRSRSPSLSRPLTESASRTRTRPGQRGQRFGRRIRALSRAWARTTRGRAGTPP